MNVYPATRSSSNSDNDGEQLISMPTAVPTWSSIMSNINASVSVTLSKTSSAYNYDGTYYIELLFFPFNTSIYNNNSNSTNSTWVPPTAFEGTFTISTTNSQLDYTLTRATPMEKFDFTGDTVSVQLDLLDSWGLEMILPPSSHLLLQLGENPNNNVTVRFGGTYTFLGPGNIGWHPWVIENVYLNGTEVGVSIGYCCK